MAVWCVWLAVFVVCIGLEAASMALTSIWFAGGALIACVLSIAGVNLYIQMAVFVVVFNKTIGTPVYQSEDGADQCGRAGG